MAKELCMVENNEKGKEARRYFIACEKELKRLGAYQLERENIELKRAMNRITLMDSLSSTPWAMNDFLDFIGYISRATKTMRELAGYADYYANTAESFLSRIQERFKNHQGVGEQCKRLPKHQMME
jgi:hypothetical protein